MRYSAGANITDRSSPASVQTIARGIFSITGQCLSACRTAHHHTTRSATMGRATLSSSIWVWLLFALFIAASTAMANAENVYVRDGASGSGADWSDALDDLPASLTRGKTYYIADGSYAAYLFDDADSGTSLITIKKATGSDHG